MTTSISNPARVVDVTDVVFIVAAASVAIPMATPVVHQGSSPAGVFCRLVVAEPDGLLVPHWATNVTRDDLRAIARRLASDGRTVEHAQQLEDEDVTLADIPATCHAIADGRAWAVVELPDNTADLCASCDARYSFIGRAHVMAATPSGRVPLCRKCACSRPRYAASARRLYPGAN